MKKLYPRAGGRKIVYVLSLIILLLTLYRSEHTSVHALQQANWSTPQTMPTFDKNAYPPILIADQNHAVHAFSTEWMNVQGGDAVRVIVYNRWTLEDGWTIPVDIVMSPVKEARLTDVILDKNGVFHLTFFGGDGTNADIYHTQAPADSVADSRFWSSPVIIGEGAGEPEGSAMFEDDQGTIFVVYTGRQQGNGLYVVSSKDKGENWSSPTPIFFTQSDEPNIAYLDIVRGKSGSWNAIWGVYSDSGQGRGIFYSNSKDGTVWSEPILLAEAEAELGTQTPTLIQYEDDLVALFNIPPKILMRRSRDDGKTWDNPSILFPRHNGVNGSLSMVTDSSNILHLFFGQRIPGSPDVHGMWHSVWDGQRWIEPEAVESGRQVDDEVGYDSFDPYAARAVVSNGNVILVTWRTDPGLKGNGVWYSYKVLNTPELPAIPLPSQAAPEIIGMPVVANTPDVSITNTPEVSVETRKLFENQNDYTGSVFGVIAIVGVVFLVAVIFVFIAIRSPHNK